MKKLLLITSLLALAPVAYGQTTSSDAAPQQECKLTLAQVPAIRGLRLGMTEKEVVEFFMGDSSDEALRSQLAITRDRFGVSNLSVNPSLFPSKGNFTNVKQVGFGFLDGRVTALWISYNGPPWDHVDQFITKLSDVYNLPDAKAWRPATLTHEKSLKCDGFVVRATGYGGGQTSVQIINPVTDKVVAERQKAEREKARQAFKP